MEYFLLFSNCILVKGFLRSTICDLQRNKIYFIPNDLANLIIDSNNLLLKQTIEKSVFFPWFQMLIVEELGFYTERPLCFPKIEMKWDSPEIINNAIIEMDNISEDVLHESIKKLNNARCKFIEFRYYKTSNIEILFDALYILRNGYVRGVIIYIPFCKDNKLLQIKKILNSTGLIREIIVHSVDAKIVEEIEDDRLFFTSQIISSNTHCGEISADYFAINLNSFSESKKFNSCLNKKISIDSSGQVRNCPSMFDHFGSIKEFDIVNVAKNKKFTKYWNISKTQISVCKDCEFKNVCTDCRAYVEEPDNQYSKPLKCGYNPYTNVWEEWSTNPLKQKAIECYSMQDLVKKDA